MFGVRVLLPQRIWGNPNPCWRKRIWEETTDTAGSLAPCTNQPSLTGERWYVEELVGTSCPLVQLLLPLTSEHTWPMSSGFKAI